MTSRGLVQLKHPQKIAGASRDERAFFKRAILAQQRASRERAKLTRRLARSLQQSERATARRLALYGTLVNRLTRAQWEQIKARYQGRCAYCQTEKPLTQDHIVPLSKGGFHTVINVIPACRSCNSRKNNRPAHLYKPTLIPFS